MEYWEFLLQKEGDQSWLPLDASQVEILEGRYRVMAHTSKTNTRVDIQISQVLPQGQRPALEEQPMPPQRRTQRRQGETNDNGLMVVMPFTRLGEGRWDIQCAGAPEGADLSAAAAAVSLWRYAVQLQVVGQDSADEGDWFADDGSAGIGAMIADQAARSASQGQSEADLAADPAPAVDLQGAIAAMAAFQRQVASGAFDGHLPYGLTLPHTALLSSEGEPLGLTATVTSSSLAVPSLPLTLLVRLSDPQTATTVALTSVPLGALTLPTSVILTVSVPSGLSTRLLLGEVGLLAGDEVMAVQQFTVTVDVAALFDAIANQAESKTDFNVEFPADADGEVTANGEVDDPEEPGAVPRPSPDLKTWDIVGRAAPAREMPILTLPRGSSDLPPKIYYPSPHEAAARQPSLPLVGRLKPTPEPASPESPAAANPESPNPELPVEKLSGLSLPPIAPPPKLSDPIAILTGQTTPAETNRPRGPEPQLLSHEAMGFKDLKLQDRFWNRLNELAVNLQQEALENRADQASPSETAISELDFSEPDSLESPVEEAAQFIPFQGEVVIYEDEDPTLRELNSAPVEVAAPEAETPSEVVTPPMPSLELPEGELIAGEAVVVTLRVPFHPNRLYLKVWITDPQTRTLADEPRQVMNLLPNGQGQLEGSLQLTAPLGCLEAWFEAIAIDMSTQQESYKTTVSRAITPSGLSSSSLDEFQL